MIAIHHGGAHAHVKRTRGLLVLDREQTSMTMKQVLALIFGMGIPARTQVLPSNLTFSTMAGVASHEAMRLL